jgi:hypothetical protein
MARKLVGSALRRFDQEQRELAEKERRAAEATRLAAIEERRLKRVLGGAIEGGYRASQPDLPKPHPSGGGRKPLTSPAGEVADKGPKWGGLLPGSFETGRR